MPELRWTLLILGALFIAGLAFWEYRRKRHARGQTLDSRFGESGDDMSRASQDSFSVGTRSDSRDSPRVYREPTLGLPDIRDRDPMAELPVVEINDDQQLAGLRVDDETAVDSFSMSADDEDEVADAHADEHEPLEDDKPATAAPMVPRLEPAEPMIAERRFVPKAADTSRMTADRAPAESAASEEPFGGASAERAAPASDDYFAEGVIGSARIVGEAPAAELDEDALASSSEPATPAAPFNVDTDAFAVTEPIVEWPEDDTRKIIALRLVSGGGERFQGRAVRQALAAEGFLLGKFDIFHKPGPDSRAVLSAASLTKPGSFTLANMDSQRFGGLSLFAVLPGPLSPTATFDELVTTARSLNDRLRGALQDERGEPLTPVRSASIRDSLTAQATAAAPVVGPPSVAAPAPESDASPH